MAEAPLRVWVLSDGRPGHYNQSRGIVHALQRIQPVEASPIAADLRFGAARNVLRACLNRDRAPASLGPLRLCCRLGALPAGGCDLIVSAGGRTSFANAWLAALLGVPNLYAGSLRRLAARRFSVVLTLEPVAGAASNLVVPVPPSAVDERALERQGAALRAQLGETGERYWTLLVGGNGAGYRYARSDWLRLARLVNALAARHAIRWLAVGSRRTGPTAERLLRQHVDPRHLAAACWYPDGGAYQAEAWLGAAERVFVTEDSMSMLAEAMHARRPVHSLRPATAAPAQRYEQALQRFAARGSLSRHSLRALAEHPELPPALADRPAPGSPTEWLAAQLEQRLGLCRCAPQTDFRGAEQHRGLRCQTERDRRLGGCDAAGRRALTVNRGRGPREDGS